jgi:acetyl esterase
MRRPVFVICLFACLFAPTVWADAKDAAPVQKYPNITWAAPDGFPLAADIYVPEGGKGLYPVLIIYHGGGWLLNSKSIMDDMAGYMASHGKYVVVNTNYRLLADQDNTVTANKIVEDAMGAVLWVKANIRKYRGDPRKIAITGDSAGGHLAGMVMLAGRTLEKDGFAGDSLGFNPSYMPKGQSPERLAKKDGLKVQAVILSYTAFDLSSAAAGGFETEKNPFWGWAKAKPRGLFGDKVSIETRPDYYKAVSPIQYIPNAKDYKLPPQFVHVGSEDILTTPAIAKDYVAKLEQANQSVQLKIYQGKGHGFLDTGCNDYTNGCFEQLAPPTLDDMIQFLDGVFKRK